jgi:hypothetical protein
MQSQKAKRCYLRTADDFLMRFLHKEHNSTEKLHEKRIVAQLAKKITAFYGPRRFAAIFINIHLNVILPYAKILPSLFRSSLPFNILYIFILTIMTQSHVFTEFGIGIYTKSYGINLT